MMSDEAIIDCHVHLWNPDQFPLPWLATTPALNRPYEIMTFQEQAAGVPIAGMVYVEVDVAPQFALLEAQNIVKLAQEHQQLQGIVATAPLEYGERVRRYLDALAALGPLIKGIRRNLQDVSDPLFFRQPPFIRGVQLLEEYGFSFDICIRHHQFPYVIELVQQCPTVRFILDHLGKPNVWEGQLDPWRQDLTRLAQLPNVAAKISGLLTEADMLHWQPVDLAPYLTHALATFGAQRLLFGGDWPVMLQAGSYRQWVDVIAAFLASFPYTTQRAIWHDNARRIYRLGTSS